MTAGCGQWHPHLGCLSSISVSGDSAGTATLGRLICEGREGRGSKPVPALSHGVDPGDELSVGEAAQPRWGCLRNVVEIVLLRFLGEKSYMYLLFPEKSKHRPQATLTCSADGGDNLP